MAPIVPGGRADVMVQCSSTPGSTHIVTGRGGVTLARLVVTATLDNDQATTDLQPWTPDYPSYLQDLRQSPPSPNCSCGIHFDRRSVNGQGYTSEAILHHSYLGAVVERDLRAHEHPYHQHVHPFQIMSGLGLPGGDNDERESSDNAQNDGGGSSSGFYQVGDWHDSVDGRGVIRYRPTTFAGKLMLHCHRLIHEDEGMMAMEYIHDPADDDALGCSCTSSAPPLKVPFVTASPFSSVSPFSTLSPFSTTSPSSTGTVGSTMAPSWTSSSILLSAVFMSVPWIAATWAVMEMI